MTTKTHVRVVIFLCRRTFSLAPTREPNCVSRSLVARSTSFRPMAPFLIASRNNSFRLSARSSSGPPRFNSRHWRKEPQSLP